MWAISINSQNKKKAIENFNDIFPFQEPKHALKCVTRVYDDDERARGLWGLA